MKKEWKQPTAIILSSVKGGANTRAKESTGLDSNGGTVGPGNPAEKVYNAAGTKFAPNWTSAAQS